MTTTKLSRSRMNRNGSRPVLKTSGAGDSLAEFNYKESFEWDSDRNFYIKMRRKYYD
jgi:hypothetical protein